MKKQRVFTLLSVSLGLVLFFSQDIAGQENNCVYSYDQYVLSTTAFYSSMFGMDGEIGDTGILWWNKYKKNPCVYYLLINSEKKKLIGLLGTQNYSIPLLFSSEKKEEAAMALVKNLSLTFEYRTYVSKIIKNPVIVLLKKEKDYIKIIISERDKCKADLLKLILFMEEYLPNITVGTESKVIKLN